MNSRILLTAVLIIAGISGCGKDKATESQGNQAVPSSPSPANGAADQPLTTTLSWECSDPDGDSLTFDVYFGTQQDPPLISSNQHETSYQPGQLQYNSMYYWKVVAKDGNNNATSGPIWSFSTPILESGLHLIGHYNTPGEASEVFASANYAYVLCGLLIIVDVSDPSQPTYRGSYSSIRDRSHIYVKGDYAYMTTYSQNGYPRDALFFIIDVLDPQQPQVTDSYDLGNTHLNDVVVDYYAYVACHDSLRRFSVANPHNIEYAGGNTWEGQRLFLSDYLYEIDTNRLRIFSGLDRVGEYYGPTGDKRDLYVKGSYAYLACGSLGLQIIDVSNPSEPSFAGAYITSDDAMGVTASGNFAFIAAAGGGLQVIDVSDPANPSLITSYETPSEALGVFFESGYIYVAAGSSGIYILQFVP